MSDQQGRRGSVAGRLAADTRVLVVEDERDIADFLRAYFRASGYDLVHVDPPSAAEVVDAVRREQPDCVMLDVRLRGFSGIDAYRLLRSDPAFAFTPIVLVTADTSAPVRALGMADGIDGYVGKPFSVHTLEDLVAGRIRRARELRDQAGEDAGVATAEQLRAQLVDQVRAAGLAGAVLSFALVRLDARARVGSSDPAVARRALAEAVSGLLPGAVVGNTDGKELGVVMAGCPAAEAAGLLSDAIAEARDSVRLPGGAAVDVDVQAGVASFPQHAATAEQLEMAADAALADAADGRGPVAVAR